ncbi:MAG: hypothetical protein E5X51_23415 [Mesorhizobium sp.]|uniref:hypothetical protein n=1 Tax=Mesorhizobium sp. TaxID=1871066 RepID=UPI00121AEA55|nr:hypothetical protein [Mesorhizobium sp.]TIQ18874.1 MAG: hypothetical protein E5X51_23415 [Mesorhizobium sp.]
MPEMRAKMRLATVQKVGDQEKLVFQAVAASKYPEDGSDENNTYARFSPSGRLELQVANPALIGKFAEGETFYIDFTKAG